MIVLIGRGNGELKIRNQKGLYMNLYCLNHFELYQIYVYAVYV